MTDSLTAEQERELRAMEAGAEGRPVEADLADVARLAADLSASRPIPEPGYAERLDRTVGESFPPEWTTDMSGTRGTNATGKRSAAGTGGWTDLFRRHFGTGRRLVLPLAAGLAGILMFTTVVVVTLDSRGPGSAGSAESTREQSVADSAAGSAAEETAAAGSTADSTSSSAPAREMAERLRRAASAESTVGQGRVISPLPGKGGRKVVQAARITLGTDPDGLQNVVNQVVAITDSHNGIVMNSSISDGEAGMAGARFRLSIPSGQVEAAIADLSGTADLRARTQETDDVTAPFNTTSDRLKTGRARVEGLLGELERAYTDEDRQRIERQLRNGRWQVRSLQQRLNRLEASVAMTSIQVSVVTDEDGSVGSDWGLGDAFGDAGRLLGVAAGVMVIALAISIPIGLMILIVLAINRAWVRHSRNRALEGN